MSESEDDASFLALLQEVAASPDVNAAGESDLLIGRQVAQFEITERLGAGGMGVVYRARDTKLMRDVALKLLPPERSDDPERRARFLREARAAAQLTHPAIAAVYDVGVDDLEDIAYIAMELVEGESLRATVARGPLAFDDVERVAMQVAKGLAKAHAAGLVHRDLKPENIMLTTEGDAKVLDFGLAKWLHKTSAAASDDSLQTRESAVMGTPGYMAPEQALGRDVDARSDVFAFGVLLYELLTGTAPFRGDTPMEAVVAVSRDEAAPLESLRDDVPAVLREVVAGCLAKDPDERFADGGELVRALGGELARPVSSLSAAGVETLDTPAGLAQSTPTPRRSPPLVIVGALVGALVVVGALLAVFVLAGRARVPDGPPSLTSIPIVSDDPAVQASWVTSVRTLYAGDVDAAGQQWASVVRRAPKAALPRLFAGLTNTLAPEQTSVEAVKMAAELAASPTTDPATRSFVQLVAHLMTGDGGSLAERKAGVDLHFETYPDVYVQRAIFVLLVKGSAPSWAMQHARELVALDAEPLFAHQQLAGVLAADGDPEEASAAAATGLERYPGDPELRLASTQLLINASRWPEVIRDLEAHLKQHPDNAAVRVVLAEAYMNTGDEEGRKREIEILMAGPYSAVERCDVATRHTPQLFGRGRFLAGHALFARGLEICLEAGLANGAFELADRRGIAALFSREPDVWPRLAETYARIGSEPDLAPPLRRHMKLARLRAEGRAAIDSRDVERLVEKQAALEALDESYFQASRAGALAWTRAPLAALRGDKAGAKAELKKMLRDPEASAFFKLVPLSLDLIVAESADDDAWRGQVAQEMQAQRAACLALVPDKDQLCRVALAVSDLTRAELAIAAREKDPAIEALYDFGRLWPNADSEHPLMLRAAALGEQLGAL